MIRQAEAADIPRIVELGSRSLLDGPYKDLIRDNPEQSARFALQVISDAKGKVLLYINDEGKTAGLLAFIIYPHYFTQELTANEIMWYVEPEDRQGCPALYLLWEAEKVAKQLGAVRMSFSAPNVEVGNLYKRFGYEAVEVSYQRKL